MVDSMLPTALGCLNLAENTKLNDVSKLQPIDRLILRLHTPLASLPSDYMGSIWVYNDDYIKGHNKNPINTENASTNESVNGHQK